MILFNNVFIIMTEKITVLPTERYAVVPKENVSCSFFWFPLISSDLN